MGYPDLIDRPASLMEGLGALGVPPGEREKLLSSPSLKGEFLNDAETEFARVLWQVRASSDADGFRSLLSPSSRELLTDDSDGPNMAVALLAEVQSGTFLERNTEAKFLVLATRLSEQDRDRLRNQGPLEFPELPSTEMTFYRWHRGADDAFIIGTRFYLVEGDAGYRIVVPRRREAPSTPGASGRNGHGGAE
jgi:hypothetical protein